MSALKKMFSRKSGADDQEESTSPGADEGTADIEPVRARGIMFAGEDDDDETPKRKAGGISFAEPPPPDPKDSKKKKAKGKHVRVVLEEDPESGKKTKSKSTSSKTKSQPPPTVSRPHYHHCSDKTPLLLPPMCVFGKLLDSI